MSPDEVEEFRIEDDDPEEAALWWEEYARREEYEWFSRADARTPLDRAVSDAEGVTP